jgi:hypothetical protein
MLPVRCSLEPFGAIRRRTDPLPFPLAAVVNVIQPTSDTAFHAQTPGADTRTSRVSPAEGLVKLAGCNSNRHGAACCDTRMRMLLTTRSPSRTDGIGFGAT